jgi:hypothetical protein
MKTKKLSAIMVPLIVYLWVLFFTSSDHWSILSITSRADNELMQSHVAARLQDNNYFQRALRGDFASANDLKPFQVMKEYIQQHSHATLGLEWKACNESLQDCDSLWNRKFVVGYYSCPDEAGNRMHRFLNALLLAMASNRTFLWDYYTKENCLLNDASIGAHATEFCESLNTLEDCDQVLKRDEWVPSFSEWKDRLKLPDQGELIESDRSEVGVNGPYDVNSTRLFRLNKRIDGYIGFQLAWYGGRIERVVAQEANRQRSRDLLLQVPSQPYLTYGLLFESVFSVQPHLLPDEELIKALPKTTVFLHSRHVNWMDNGTDISWEDHCLKQMLANYSDPCAVLIMSDRELSIPMLMESTRQVGCTPVVVTNRVNASRIYRDEHGKFQGIGYYQDYALVRHARTAGIAVHLRSRKLLRTSSGFLRNTIEFRRALEATNATLDILPVCVSRKIPFKTIGT